MVHSIANLFDTHAHLNDARFDADRSEVLEACLRSGVDRIVEVADDPDDWARAIALCRARPFVRCALGLHPYYADRWQPELADELGRKAELPEVVAAGEIGLDLAKAPAALAAQKAALEGMLAAAWDCRLPVVLHCRAAYPELLPVLESFYKGKAPRGRFHGVVHCFSGTRDDALRAKDLGFALGADGPVTYPKNEALRAALAAAGLEVIVLETDSPYLPPQSRRGQRNDPLALPEIAQALARCLRTTDDDVARRTLRNALDLYRLED